MRCGRAHVAHPEAIARQEGDPRLHEEHVGQVDQIGRVVEQVPVDVGEQRTVDHLVALERSGNFGHSCRRRRDAADAIRRSIARQQEQTHQLGSVVRSRIVAVAAIGVVVVVFQLVIKRSFALVAERVAQRDAHDIVDENKRDECQPEQVAATLNIDRAQPLVWRAERLTDSGEKSALDRESAFACRCRQWSGWPRRKRRLRRKRRRRWWLRLFGYGAEKPLDAVGCLAALQVALASQVYERRVRDRLEAVDAAERDRLVGLTIHLHRRPMKATPASSTPAVTQLVYPRQVLFLETLLLASTHFQLSLSLSRSFLVAFLCFSTTRKKLYMLNLSCCCCFFSCN